MALGVNTPFRFPTLEMFVGRTPQKPRCVMIPYDFTTLQDFDFTLYEELKYLEYVQSIYVDNRSNANPLRIHFAVSEFHVSAPAQSQMWSPVICPNPPKFHVHYNGSAQGWIYLLNVFVPPATWLAV